MREFWRACRPQRLRSLSAWSEAEIVLPNGPAEGRRFRLDRMPYARLLLNEFGKWRRHVIVGPTQSGKTVHAFVLPLLYHLFEVREDVIVGVPDLTMAGVKWEKDIRPMIERSKYRKELPKRGGGSKGGRPEMLTFANGRSILFLGGGGNDKQRAGATSRVLLVTETDGLDEVSASSKEGQDKLSQLEGRVRAFGLNHIIGMECTVTTRSGRTWREYVAGTESRIACRCVHCDVFVTPEREHFVGWDQAQTKIEAGKKAAFSCPACGQLINEAQRKKMNADCVLVHRGQEVSADGTVTGAAPDTDTLGFRWSAFNNLFTPIELIGMEEWEAAHCENPQVAEVRIKQQVWVVPADEERIEKVPLSIGIVRGSANGYSGRCNGRDQWVVPDWAQYLTAHVDVGMRVLNWAVNAHGPRGIRDVIAYGATATEQPDVIGPEQAILAGLHRVRELIESRCDLSLGIVDCKYQGNRREKNPRKVVYEFVLSCGHPWNAAIGLAAWSPKRQSETIEPSLTGDPWYYSLQEYADQELWVLDFDPNHFKHLSHGSFLVRPSDDRQLRSNGSVTLFGSDPRAHNEFAAQLNNERFEINHKTGRSEWKRHGHNHFFDNDVGNLVARSVLESIAISQRPAEPERQSIPAVTTPDGRAFFVGNR